MSILNILKSLLGFTKSLENDTPKHPIEDWEPKDDKPNFRFYPGAYADECLKKADHNCVNCRRSGTWLYSGSIYSTCRDKPVCAACIAEDRLAERFGSFVLFDADFSDEVDAEVEGEVMQRTPGFPTFNPFVWPVSDGMPMVYMGVGDDKQFWRDEACREAMKQFWRQEIGGDLDGPAYQLLVFKSLDNSKFGFALDLD
jgi:uncharacterized protein